MVKIPKVFIEAWACGEYMLPVQRLDFTAEDCGHHKGVQVRNHSPVVADCSSLEHLLLEVSDKPVDNGIEPWALEIQHEISPLVFHDSAARIRMGC